MIRLYSTLFFLFYACAVFAQNLSSKNYQPLLEGTPQSVGISAERLNKLDAMLEEAIRNDETDPGFPYRRQCLEIQADGLLFNRLIKNFSQVPNFGNL